MGIFRDDDDKDEEYTGQTGDPLHDAVYGWDMGSVSGSGDDSFVEMNAGHTINATKRDSYSKKAWDSYMAFKEEEALRYIDLALDLDRNHSNNWNIKAIVLEAMKRYPESEKCYGKALELSFTDKVCDNKIRMLYDWASELIEESKKLPDASDRLKEAKEINMRALAARPGQKSEEAIEKYLTQRDTIRYYIDCEIEYRRNLETLKSFDNAELFTITGMQFHKSGIRPAQGMPLKLVKEPYNEHDRNAIAVYVMDEKIGYVANNDYSKYELTSSASELQDKFQNIAQGIYLLNLRRFGDMQFAIGRIMK